MNYFLTVHVEQTTQTGKTVRLMVPLRGDKADKGGRKWI